MIFGDMNTVAIELEGEACGLLRLIIDRMHISSDADGVGDVRMDFSLSESEFKWLCNWGVATEDVEDDAPCEANQDEPVR